MTVRVNAIVEGQTEETFVRQVLAPHLGSVGVFMVARSVETSRHHAGISRGGVVDYERVKRDLVRWMRGDDHDNCFFTTMIDLYRLPPRFPGYQDARRQRDPYLRVKVLEDAFGEDLDHPRFIPYIQLHEFEALVLADPTELIAEFDRYTQAVQNLVNLSQERDSPELIDDGADTAPSMRIVKEIPGYAGRKVSAGPRILGRIGLPTLRLKCPHFDAWICKLEALAGRPTLPEGHLSKE